MKPEETLVEVRRDSDVQIVCVLGFKGARAARAISAPNYPI